MSNLEEPLTPEEEACLDIIEDQESTYPDAKASLESIAHQQLEGLIMGGPIKE